MAVLVDAIVAVLAVWALFLLSKIEIVTLKIGYIKILLAVTIVVHSSMVHAKLAGQSEVFEAFRSVNEFIFVAFGIMLVCIVKRFLHDYEN